MEVLSQQEILERLQNICRVSKGKLGLSRFLSMMGMSREKELIDLIGEFGFEGIEIDWSREIVSFDVDTLGEEIDNLLGEFERIEKKSAGKLAKENKEFREHQEHIINKNNDQIQRPPKLMDEERDLRSPQSILHPTNEPSYLYGLEAQARVLWDKGYAFGCLTDNNGKVYWQIGEWEGFHAMDVVNAWQASGLSPLMVGNARFTLIAKDEKRLVSTNVAGGGSVVLVTCPNWHGKYLIYWGPSEHRPDIVYSKATELAELVIAPSTSEVPDQKIPQKENEAEPRKKGWAAW